MNGKLDGTQHRRCLRQLGQEDGFAGRKICHPPVLADTELLCLRGTRRWEQVAADCPADPLQDLGVRRGLAIPGAERLGQLGPPNVPMVDGITRAVVGARVGQAKRFLEWNGHPRKIGTLGIGPGPGQRAREERFGKKYRVLDGVSGIGRTALADKVIGTVYFVVPGAAVPVVVAGEVEDAGAFEVKCNIEIVGLLVEEMAGVGAFVASPTIVGAAEVSSHADPMIGPALPLAVGVQTNRNHRWLLSCNWLGKQYQQSPNTNYRTCIASHRNSLLSCIGEWIVSIVVAMGRYRDADIADDFMEQRCRGHFA